MTTVTDTELTTMATALAVIFVGELERQTAPLLERLHALERRAGIEPSAADLQSEIPVGGIAGQLHAALVSALDGR